MPYSTRELVRVSTLNRHVSNQVSNIAHLLLLTSWTNSDTPMNWIFLRRRCLITLRIKAFQLLQWRCVRNVSTIVWDDHDRVAIKVRTRQSFRYFGMDENGIWRLATLPQPEKLTCFSRLIIDRKFWDLEGTSVRVPHKSNALTVLERRRKDLVWLHVIRGQQNLVCLTR